MKKVSSMGATSTLKEGGGSGSEKEPLHLETATVKLPVETLKFLHAEATARGVSMGDMLRIALGTHQFLTNKVRGGAKVQLRDRARTWDVTI